MSLVFFLEASRMDTRQDLERLLAPFAYEDSGGGSDLTGVKIHPGEEGNGYYISPGRIRGVTDALRLPAGRTFLTDTTVLYGGRRMSAPDYALLAAEHGFGPPDTPPFLVADGLRGTSEVTVPLPPVCGSARARLASLLVEADSLVVVSHFKGHLATGFGGAIKNLGMGCASRGGKLYQHSALKPLVHGRACTACGNCASHCPAGAIRVGDSAVIDGSACIGCAECIQRCPEGAIGVDWGSDSGAFVKRMTESALGAAAACRISVYVNFVVDVSPDCDCMAHAGAPIVPDLGILVSDDPVAVDQASLDLVNGVPGGPADRFLALRPDRDGTVQLEHGQSIGLGSREYALRTV
jgi:uncharacterized Fe-S center protein